MFYTNMLFTAAAENVKEMSIGDLQRFSDTV